MTEKLLALLQLELEIDKVKDEIDSYQSNVRENESKEAELRTALETTKAQLEGLERERRDMEGELKLGEERLRKSKKKVAELKKDYEIRAMQREVEAARRSNAEFEEAILKKMEEIDEVKKSIEEQTSTWNAVTETLKKAQEEAAVKTKELQGVIDAKEEERKSAEDGIDRALLSRYRRIREKKHLDALVKVTSYSCEGCHMNVPPQIVNVMMREKTIDSCPNCQRLIYVDPS